MPGHRCRLLAHPRLPPQDMRQLLMFTASLPDEVRQLASSYLRPNAVLICVGNGSGAGSLVEHVSQGVVRCDSLASQSRQSLIAGQ
jgi:superfamily II DNA/RNA helicase